MNETNSQHPTHNTLHASSGPTPDPLNPTPSTVEPSSKPKLLIVDDDEGIRTQLKWALVDEFEVFLAENRSGAMEILRNEHPAVITLDLGLPPAASGVEEGFFALEELLSEDQLAKVIVITGREEREHALKAVADGAYDYFCKPVDLEELKVILRRAVHVYRLEKEYQDLPRRLGGETFEDMLGSSEEMHRIFSSIRKVANSDVPVLIVGESGTGKEMVAKAIHRQSSNSNGPFVPINCAAIPEQLLESELFGHEKGAFTGAHIQRKGRIESARRGTLFLDEIGELSLALQVKLLRFLQEHQLERVGGREVINVNTRVVVATHLDLKQAMQEGRFREDLYYRLGVVTLTLPPLRERKEDILLLARAVLDSIVAGEKKKPSGFSRNAVLAMDNYGWPGNIRELENRIKRAVIMAEGSKITPDDLELAHGRADSGSQGLLRAREALEKNMVQQALARHKGNVTRAAAELSISRPTLYDLMEKLGIEKQKPVGNRQ